jgi:hypothetical protein
MPLTQINNTVSDTTNLTANNASYLGGIAASGFSQLGVGQTWQVVTRNQNTTYTNSTGKPITCMFYIDNASLSTNSFTIVLGGVTMFSVSMPAGENETISFIVPNGTTYRINGSSIGITAAELR